MVAVTAHVKVKEGMGEELERVMKALAEKVLANEPGCEQYQLCRSKQDPQAYVVMERYQDDDALGAHANSEHFKAAIPEMMACCEGPPNILLFDEV